MSERIFKRGGLIFASFLALSFSSCDVNNTVVGGGTTINGVTFTVDTTYVDGGAGELVAKGLVKNSGKGTITSPWYIEAQFYTDSTYITKLGGSNTQIGVPLSTGQQTFWKISFSSSTVEVRQYPNFKVDDLRAYYSN